MIELHSSFPPLFCLHHTLIQYPICVKVESLKVLFPYLFVLILNYLRRSKVMRVSSSIVRIISTSSRSSTFSSSPNSQRKNHNRNIDDQKLVLYADFSIRYEFISHNHRNLADAVRILEFDMLTFFLQCTSKTDHSKLPPLGFLKCYV